MYNPGMPLEPNGAAVSQWDGGPRQVRLHLLETQHHVGNVLHGGVKAERQHCNQEEAGSKRGHEVCALAVLL
jgi:hypothetical protein